MNAHVNFHICSSKQLAWAVNNPVSRRSSGRLATTLVATKNIFIFFFARFPPFFSSSVAAFFHRRTARIKKLIYSQKLTGAPKNLGVDTIPDPVSYFEAHSGHLGLCRRCSIAGSERVPLAPLGWYYLNVYLHIYINFFLHINVHFHNHINVNLKCELQCSSKCS